MPSNISSTNSRELTQALADAVTNNPDLRDRVNRLVISMIDRVEWIMRYGSPTEKMSLVRAVIPDMMRALRTAKDSDEATAQRQTYERIITQMREAAGQTSLAHTTSPPNTTVNKVVVDAVAVKSPTRARAKVPRRNGDRGVFRLGPTT